METVDREGQGGFSELAALPPRTLRFARRQRAATRLGMRPGLLRSRRLPPRVRLGGEWASLRLPPTDHTVHSPLVEVLLDDCYGVRRLSAPARILDIGGHVGFFSLAARASHPEALIHCYEPNPKLWPYVSHQADEAGFIVFPEAVGAGHARVSLEYRESAEEGSMHTRTHEDRAGAVAQIPFAEAVGRMGGEVDLAKIDCEGAEWSFLDSPAWSRVRRVAMEYHLWPDHTASEARRALRDLGFTIARHAPGDGYGLLWGIRYGPRHWCGEPQGTHRPKWHESSPSPCTRSRSPAVKRRPACLAGCGRCRIAWLPSPAPRCLALSSGTTSARPRTPAARAAGAMKSARVRPSPGACVTSES